VLAESEPNLSGQLPDPGGSWTLFEFHRVEAETAGGGSSLASRGNRVSGPMENAANRGVARTQLGDGGGQSFRALSNRWRGLRRRTGKRATAVAAGAEPQVGTAYAEAPSRL